MWLGTRNTDQNTQVRKTITRNAWSLWVNKISIRIFTNTWIGFKLCSGCRNYYNQMCNITPTTWVLQNTMCGVEVQRYNKFTSQNSRRESRLFEEKNETTSTIVKYHLRRIISISQACAGFCPLFVRPSCRCGLPTPRHRRKCFWHRRRLWPQLFRRWHKVSLEPPVGAWYRLWDQAKRAPFTNIVSYTQVNVMRVIK